MNRIRNKTKRINSIVGDELLNGSFFACLLLLTCWEHKKKKNCSFSIYLQIVLCNPIYQITTLLIFLFCFAFFEWFKFKIIKYCWQISSFVSLTNHQAVGSFAYSYYYYYFYVYENIWGKRKYNINITNNIFWWIYTILIKKIK